MKILPINSVSIKEYSSNNQTQTVSDNKTLPVFVNKPDTDKKDKRKRNIWIGTTAVVLLALLLGRNKIKDLIKRIGGKKFPPDKPEPPKVDPPKIDPPKPNLEEIKKQEADALLSEYRELVKNQGEFPSGGTEAEKAAWHETDNRRRELINEICNRDISIIEKQEFSADPLVDADKKNLYLSSLTWRSSFNMATQSDIIGEYEKYLTRGWLPGETRRSSIFEFSRACWPVDAKCNPTDEYLYSVADRYLSVMERIAERDNAGMRDAVHVNGVMQFYKEVMDENLALKYIELLKRISFQQVDGMQAEYHTSKVDSPKVKQAILELKEALKEYPFEDKTKND